MIRQWGGWPLFQDLLAVTKSVADKHGVSIPNVGVRWVLDRREEGLALRLCFLKDEKRSVGLPVVGRPVYPPVYALGARFEGTRACSVCVCFCISFVVSSSLLPSTLEVCHTRSCAFGR